MPFVVAYLSLSILLSVSSLSASMFHYESEKVFPSVCFDT